MSDASVGYDGRGKRVVRRASGRNKTEARDKLRALMRDRDGFAIRNAKELATQLNQSVS